MVLGELQRADWALIISIVGLVVTTIWNVASTWRLYSGKVRVKIVEIDESRVRFSLVNSFLNPVELRAWDLHPASTVQRRMRSLWRLEADLVGIGLHRTTPAVGSFIIKRGRRDIISPWIDLAVPRPARWVVVIETDHGHFVSRLHTT